MYVEKIMIIYLCVINLIAFLLYGIDKKKAEHHAWRISENTLILMAVLGGGLGSYLAMHAFHHKTQHKKFTILVPFFLILWITGIVYFYLKVR
jgi:uncharacterized membrane protein YsdA (DUF1294 family)